MKLKVLRFVSLASFSWHGYVRDTVRVFIPKCPLTTARSRFSVEEIQIVRGKAEDTIVVVRTKSSPNGCKRTLWKKKKVQVSDLCDGGIAT